MRLRKLKFLISAIAISSSAWLHAEVGEIVWWEITDGNDFKYTNTKGEVIDFDITSVTDARIAARAEGAQTWDYLDIYAYDQTTHQYDYFGKDIPQPGAFFSPIPIDAYSSYQFIVELGNWVDGQWVKTELVSDIVTYDYLASREHVTTWIDGVANYAQPWIPTSYTVVPEPSGGLLFLLGSAMLALRRKRRHEA